jgi:PIN domain nuclease of toxin-antitoxin system
MSTPKNLVLIDTHILIWMMSSSEQLQVEDKERLKHAMHQQCLYVSSISFWEIAMLVQYNRLSLGIPLQQWIQEVLTVPGLQLVDISLPILLESVQLPGECHKDPADRIIVATARIHHYELLTHDQKIMTYARNGNLRLVS